MNIIIKKILKTLVFAVFIVLSYSPHVFANYSKAGLNLLSKFVEQSRDHANNIQTMFPPEESHILFLGRSGLGMSSWIKNNRSLKESKDYITEFPVEGLSNITNFSKKNKDLFFKKMLPSPLSLGSKKLVISRVLFKSITVSDILEDLLEYLVDNNYPLPLESYFVSDVSRPYLYRFLDFQKITPEYFKLNIQKDKKYSKLIIDQLAPDIFKNKSINLFNYSQFLPKRPEEIIKPNFHFPKNKKHNIFKKAILKFSLNKSSSCSDILKTLLI